MYQTVTQTRAEKYKVPALGGLTFHTPLGKHAWNKYTQWTRSKDILLREKATQRNKGEGAPGWAGAVATGNWSAGLLRGWHWREPKRTKGERPAQEEHSRQRPTVIARVLTRERVVCPRSSEETSMHAARSTLCTHTKLPILTHSVVYI